MSHGTNLSNFNVLKRTIKKKRNPPHPVPLVPPARCMVVSQAPLLRVVFPSLISALRCLCSECSLLPMLVPPSGPAAAPQRGEAGGGLGVWPGVTRGCNSASQTLLVTALSPSNISGAGATLAQFSRSELGGPWRWSVSFLPTALARDCSGGAVGSTRLFGRTRRSGL